MLLEKMKTALWFAQRPSFWAHARELGLRKFRADHDDKAKRDDARAWAARRAVPVGEALRIVGLPGEPLSLDPAILAEGQKRASRSSVKMGGAGDLALLHSAVVLSGARRVVETGVAYGWSSLAILAVLDRRDGARLVSVDMPYPKMNNEAFVGVVVPERLRSRWQLIREPDRRGLEKAIASQGGTIDLCHYDSDKSWWGRSYAYPLLWNALRPGGIFISDDIQDNTAFAALVGRLGINFAVTESDGKFVGIIRKPE
jgi:predicted O-methyltransferase YrrM